jgi:bacillithiol biosynthesis cysteine-adding enzyme BshC
MLSGVWTVKGQCLPFSQIPHTTRLFADYLSYSPQVQPFYPRSPHFHEWFPDEATRIQFEPARRKAVAAVLERQNRSWNASEETLKNISRLAKGAAAVVTGQQVGLFGGPAFGLYKAITAVRLAAEATAAGVDAVPVFWLATTDHDLAEVNHVTIPRERGGLTKLTTTSHGLIDAPVSEVVLGAEIEPVVAQAAALLGDTDAAQAVRDAYRPGETLGSAFAKLFARWLGEWGVILLDAADPELSRLCAPIYRAAIERAAELNDLLLGRGKELEQAGYHQQVKVTSASILLFALQNGVRTPIHRVHGGGGGNFAIGAETVTPAELLERIENRPEEFNGNALFRPVVQDYLLPTLAYCGGSAEIAYFAQSAVVYEALSGRVTPVLPRFSATLLEARSQRLFRKYGIDLTVMFRGEEALQNALASRTLPQGVRESFATAEQTVDAALSGVEKSLFAFDVTLVESAQRSTAKMRYQLSRLRSRVARAEARRNEEIARHVRDLTEMLYPQRGLQERTLGGVYFMAKYGAKFLHDLYETIQPDCHDHQVIPL